MPTVLVPLAEGFEEIEAVTIIDVLRRAGIEVIVAGLNPGAVRGSHGIALLPDLTLDQAIGGNYDLIALPGGMPGAENLDRDPRLHHLLTAMSLQGKFIAAICAAPKVLANAGLLKDRKATSYPGFLDATQPGYSEDAVVIDGKVITSRSVATAMQFALVLVEKLVGPAKRGELEKKMLVKR